jgi:F-type H+/Na+-transporting ATPase subunit alpha
LELGSTLAVIDGVARAIKIKKSFMTELTLLDCLIFGLIITLNKGTTNITIMGNDRFVEQGDLVERTFAELIILVGFTLLGRVIDPLGNFLDMRKLCVF